MNVTSDPLTPMMQQYRRIKANHRDAIVFFRLGDFYEMFFEDAEVASSLLDITLTARNRGKLTEAPMCGVPAHAADGYVARLLEAGCKVAIAEQVGDPATTKGTLERQVVRVITPGTLVEDNLLHGKENNYLVAVLEDADSVGLAALELSTGEFVAAEFNGRQCRSQANEELGRWAPREVCHPEGADVPDWLRPCDSFPGAEATWSWSVLPPWSFEAEQAEARLCDHFGVTSLAGYDLSRKRLAIGAAGALLRYAAETQRTTLSHIRTIRRHRERDSLQLDATTRRTLELVESWQDRSRSGTLLEVIDQTVTSMGGRRLRQWLLWPLRDVSRIQARQRVVAQLVDQPVGRAALRTALARVRDLERLATRLALGSATPRDLAALRSSLEVLPDARQVVAELIDGELAVALIDSLDPCEDVAATIARQLTDEPPATLAEGGIIREGFNDELDHLRRARREGKQFIAGLQSRERQRTGIGSLKVGFNKVFGYYIEVSKPNLPKVPEEYTRKQTLTNAERFVTPELKEFEETVLTAEEKIGAMECQLFTRLREAVAAEAPRLHKTAASVAKLDALAALAEVAAQHDYVCPKVDDSRTIEIRQGRHPVVELQELGQRFVPNDTYLDDSAHRIQLLTGPNMGGKSTYLRQVALIVVLAQMGGFVPAEFASVGVVDRIFTRVGASDNLARGASTFLVEMQETANILHHATPSSLVILDEVGRGTSTYDGLALAWAVVEYLQQEMRVAARTLFATHYHELTSLDGVLPGVENLNVAAQETGDGVVFLHRVEPGPADRSYGIHVARLAGLPIEAVRRAEEILARLEAGQPPLAGGPAWAPPGSGAQESRQLALFQAPDHPLLRQLREISIAELSPLEALNLLARWQDYLADEGEGGE
ncbi:MAG: DNA mismatch repair protein MutS [Acidobacteriota bacterium]